MRKRLLAFLFAMTVVLSSTTALYGNDGLRVEQSDNVQHVVLEDTYEEVKPLTYRERLDYQVSRGEVRSMMVETTAYTHTGNATYTGIMPYVGVIAVDPEVIPLGSRVYVEGYGEAIAADTGGAIQGHIIDLFMNTEEECNEHGRKTRKIYILGR